MKNNSYRTNPEYRERIKEASRLRYYEKKIEQARHFDMMKSPVKGADTVNVIA